MSSSMQLLTQIAPGLLPFLNTIIIYFVLFIPDNQPSLWAMFIKCCPILCLMLFVILQTRDFQDEKKYSRHILLGLIFSCGGDALLIWPQCFLFGMISFAVAQAFYIKAFGFQSLNISIAVPLFAFCLYVLSILMKNATDEFLVGLPVYSVLLVTMLWRAAARAVPTKRESWAWTKLSSCLGGLCFVASDAFIGFDRFHAPLENAQVKIMVTYYLAQLGIALSVVNNSHKDAIGATDDSKVAKNNNQYKKKIN